MLFLRAKWEMSHMEQTGTKRKSRFVISGMMTFVGYNLINCIVRAYPMVISHFLFCEKLDKQNPQHRAKISILSDMQLSTTKPWSWNMKAFSAPICHSYSKSHPWAAWLIWACEFLAGKCWLTTKWIHKSVLTSQSIQTQCQTIQ